MKTRMMREIGGRKSKRTSDVRPDGADLLVECDQNVPDEKSESGNWEKRWLIG